MWEKHRKLVRDALLKVETDCKQSLFSVFHPFIALKCFQMGGQFHLGSNQKKQCELSFYCAVYDAADMWCCAQKASVTGWHK